MTFNPDYNMMQNGVASMFATLRRVAGQTVQYMRAGQLSADLQVTSAEKTHRVVDMEGFTTWLTTRDYLMAADTLIVSGTKIQPRPGDYVLETLEGEDMIFEVVPISDDRPCYEWSDLEATHYRVHTKRVK